MMRLQRFQLQSKVLQIEFFELPQRAHFENTLL